MLMIMSLTQGKLISLWQLHLTLTITPHSVGQPPAQASGPGTNKQTAGGDTEAGARDAAQEMDGAGAGGA